MQGKQGKYDYVGGYQPFWISGQIWNVENVLEGMTARGVA